MPFSLPYPPCAPWFHLVGVFRVFRGPPFRASAFLLWFPSFTVLHSPFSFLRRNLLECRPVLSQTGESALHISCSLFPFSF
ncbi:MAG: hypothetical protein D6679_13255 [Candidatus Hydrogenedentota bacterium]|nr:MAG: hypothetical protein D6679_13255 [Candidatus Hydrogenedentota bacterium]